MNKNKVECAWCGQVLREGVLPVSHGICPNCLDDMTPKVSAHEVVSTVSDYTVTGNVEDYYGAVSAVEALLQGERNLIKEK